MSEDQIPVYVAVDFEHVPHEQYDLRRHLVTGHVFVVLEWDGEVCLFYGLNEVDEQNQVLRFIHATELANGAEAWHGTWLGRHSPIEPHRRRVVGRTLKGYLL